MGRAIDLFVTYRFIKLLVTPFEKTEAFKLGIIDDKGKVLIKSKQIVNQRQRKAYTLLIRFVFVLISVSFILAFQFPILNYR